MTSFSIHKFQSELGKSGGFARSHLFKCNITPPRSLQNYPGARNRILFCKGAKLPSFEISTSKLRFMTREVTVPGARRYSPFVVTFYNTNDYNAYNFFTVWQKLISPIETNKKGYADGYENPVETDPLALTADIIFDQFSPESSGNSILESVPILNLFISGDNISIATYVLKNAFPTKVDGLEFSSDGESAVQTFDVEFSYLNMDYITPTQKLVTPPVLPPLDGATPYGGVPNLIA